jgi:hypothetical protein
LSPSPFLWSAQQVTVVVLDPWHSRSAGLSLKSHY